MKQMRNYTLEEVTSYVDNWLPKMDVCQCESCRLDVITFMLNRLPPNYGISEKGAMFSQLKEFDPQYQADLISLLSDAIRLINDSPNH